MNNIKDIFSPSNPESQENITTIIDVTANRILKDYKDARKPVPSITYPSFSPELDRSHPYVDLIVDNIHKSVERVFSPEPGSYITPDILRRIFEGVFIKLKLHPIREKDKQGNVQLYQLDSELRDELGQPSDAIEHHNRVKNHLDQMLWDMNQKLTGYHCDRYDALKGFFHARNSGEKEQQVAMVLSCFADIAKTKEEIIAFCDKNHFENPFNSSRVVANNCETFYLEDKSEIANAWRIFHLSPAEIYLNARFLPEGTRKNEPYLFRFLLSETGLSSQELLSQTQLIDFYTRAHERKLLTHYFASNSKREPKDYQESRDIAYNIGKLKAEIREYQEYISYEISTGYTEGENVLEDEDDDDISRLEMLYKSADALCHKYAAVNPNEISQVFDDISNQLKLFIERMKSQSTSEDLTDDGHNQMAFALKFTLHDSLQLLLDKLGDSTGEPITAMRRVLHEALEFLVHD